MQIIILLSEREQQFSFILIFEEYKTARILIKENLPAFPPLGCSNLQLSPYLQYPCMKNLQTTIVQSLLYVPQLLHKAASSSSISTIPKRELGVKNFVVSFSSHKWLYLTYVRCKHRKAWSISMISQAKTKQSKNVQFVHFRFEFVHDPESNIWF